MEEVFINESYSNIARQERGCRHLGVPTIGSDHCTVSVKGTGFRERSAGS
jgi:hypothetical protein